MEDRERVLITEAVLTVGALIVIKKMRDRKKKQSKEFREDRSEFAALLRDLLTWMEKEGPHLTEDDFVTEYNNRVQFINIVAHS